MTRPLSSRTTVPLLKQEAKRWLRALRAHDGIAHARLRAAWPDAPDPPTLRDVQHALAHEYGAASWVALTERLADDALVRAGRATWGTTLLSHGWSGEVATARRIARLAPELARESLHVAAAMGDLDEVARHLQRDPAAVHATCPVRGWTALAHVAYGRVDTEHALAIAERLLDAGADVHFTFTDDWDNPFTLLTGVAGDGEGATPAHPQARALAAMFLDRGIDSFDTQLLYNTSLHHDDVYWLELLWQRAVQAGTTDRWLATEGRVLGGRFRSNTLDYLLGNAVLRRHPQRVAWLLAHGASARARHAYSGRLVHTEARLQGFREGLALLEQYGAEPEPLNAVHAFVAAAMLHDEQEVHRLLTATPALIERAAPLHAAAQQNRTEVVALLLSLGADPNASDHEGARPLHRAAQGGAAAAATVLLDARADVNARDARFHDTPLSWAIVLEQPAVIELLVPVSHDVRGLARLGETERLREVLQANPALANERVARPESPMPLYCFASDDDVAAEVAHLLLSHGADPAVRNADGRRPWEMARAAGLERTASVLHVP